MTKRKFFRPVRTTVLAVSSAMLLMAAGTAFSQTTPGAAGGASRSGGGGREYRGEPTRMLESREMPSPVKQLTDRLCDPDTLESSAYAGVFQYSCLGPEPAGLAVRPGDPPVPRAKIHIDCDEKDGKPVNCVGNCTADEDSDCSGFIAACVDTDHTTEGNKGSAKCYP